MIESVAIFRPGRERGKRGSRGPQPLAIPWSAAKTIRKAWKTAVRNGHTRH